MPRLSERLAALERTEPDARRLLPVVLPDTATDAVLEGLRRAGLEVFRAGDPALCDAFV